MSRKKVLLGMTALLVASAFGNDFYAVSNSENLPIYENRIRQINESAITTVSTTENLLVKESESGFFKVQTEDGDIGWVESDKVTKTDKQVETFKGVQVTGIGTEPSPININSAVAEHSAPIPIDRSFKDALLQNTSKDQVTRAQ